MNCLDTINTLEISQIVLGKKNQSFNPPPPFSILCQKAYVCEKGFNNLPDMKFKNLSDSNRF